MGKGLRRIAFVIGMGILLVSIFWSQDGFNFNIAGDSGYDTTALFIGWFLAVAFSVLQFVFSSNFRELNMSLILLGAIAYGYSIYTNEKGIAHFQGAEHNVFWAWALAFFLDASAEPLIAWSLGVSREGDFLGNIVKAIAAFIDGVVDSGKGHDFGKREDNRGNSSKNVENRRPEPVFHSNPQISQKKRALNHQISQDFMKSLQSSRKFEKDLQKNLHGVNSDDEEME